MEQEIKDISIERIRKYHPDALGIGNDLLIDYTEHFVEEGRSPIYKFPLRMDGLFIALREKGVSDFSINLKEFLVGPNELVIGSPGDLMQSTINEGIYLSQTLMVSSNFLKEMYISLNSFMPFFASRKEKPVFLLTDNEVQELKEYFVLIMDAVKRGCRDFLVGVCGSATNDAGMGMLQALGFRFYDIDDQEIIDGCGGRLQDVARIDDTVVMDAVRQCRFTVACDVDTPFCGSEGAAYVFAPQKGADMEMVARLDSGMVSFAKVIEKTYGIDVTSMAVAGAAGGMGGGFYAFLNASLKRGVDMVLDAIDFDSIIRGADLVITGEGKIDYQTVKGKTAAGVLARAKAQDIPVVAIAGRVEMCDSVAQMGFAGVYPIMENEMPLAVAMQPDCAAANVEKTVKKIVTNLHIS